MNSLSIFGGFDGSKVRWNGNPDAPEWVAKDVCDVLAIANVSDALSRMPDHYKGDDIGLTDTIGRTQQLSTVKEAGLYKLIFASRKKEAEAFREWVFEQVLPSIRATGSYTTPQRDRLPDQIVSLRNAELTIVNPRLLPSGQKGGGCTIVRSTSHPDWILLYYSFENRPCWLASYILAILHPEFEWYGSHELMVQNIHTLLRQMPHGFWEERPIPSFDGTFIGINVIYPEGVEWLLRRSSSQHVDELWDLCLKSVPKSVSLVKTA